MQRLKVQVRLASSHSFAEASQIWFKAVLWSRNDPWGGWCSCAVAIY